MRGWWLLLAAFVSVSASAQPPVDAGVRELGLPLTWVYNGVPDVAHGSDWAGGVLVVRGDDVWIQRPGRPDVGCDEIARRDLTPDAGDERVYGCWNLCAAEGAEQDDRDVGPDLGPFQVVAVVGASGPIIGIATSPDMSCGSRVTFRRAGPRWRMQLEGGGEDGHYRVTYGLRGTRFESVAMHYQEYDY